MRPQIATMLPMATMPRSIFRTLFSFRVAAALLMTLAVAPAAAGYKEGVLSYRNGELARAVKELLPVAKAGNPEAQILLAQILMNGGKGVTKDQREGLVWVRRSAEGGNRDAQVFLAKTLTRGTYGATIDLAAAAHWYSKAAQAGDERAMRALARIHLEGSGTPKDPAAAVPWLRKLAAAGDRSAETQLGVLALRGEGVPKDPAVAAGHFSVATKAGDDGAAFMLAQLHGRGLGVALDAKESLRLLRLAATAGNFNAMAMLANTLANGGDGVERDDEEAYKWLTIVLNRVPQGDLFFSAAAMELQLRQRLSAQRIERAQVEASRFVAQPMTPAAAGK